MAPLDVEFARMDPTFADCGLGEVASAVLHMYHFEVLWMRGT